MATLFSLDRLKRASPSLDGAQRADLVNDALAELRATKPKKRVKAAKSAGLPESASRLGRAAGPLLAYLLDDQALRIALGDATIAVWCDIDRGACAAHALSHAAQLSPLALVTLLRVDVDPSEAYDVIAPRLRTDSTLRDALAHHIDVATVRPALRDHRFVALALETLATGSAQAASACLLLGAQGSPAAVDELRGIVEKARRIDDLVAFAIDGLERAVSEAELFDVVAALIARFDAPDGPAGHSVDVARTPLAIKVGMMSGRLHAHPAVQANPRVLSAVMRCAMRVQTVAAG